MAHRKWKNVEKTVNIYPSKELLIDLEFDTRIERLELDVLTSGFSDDGQPYGPPEDSWPPELEIEVEDILHAVEHHKDGNSFDMEREDCETLLDSADATALITDEIEI